MKDQSDCSINDTLFCRIHEEGRGEPVILSGSGLHGNIKTQREQNRFVEHSEGYRRTVVGHTSFFDFRIPRCGDCNDDPI